MFKGISPILYAGREVLPLIEGGKGVSATNGMSSGAWAAAGTFGAGGPECDCHPSPKAPPERHIYLHRIIARIERFGSIAEG